MFVIEIIVALLTENFAESRTKILILKYIAKPYSYFLAVF